MSCVDCTINLQAAGKTALWTWYCDELVPRAAGNADAFGVNLRCFERISTSHLPNLSNSLLVLPMPEIIPCIGPIIGDFVGCLLWTVSIFVGFCCRASAHHFYCMSYDTLILSLLFASFMIYFFFFSGAAAGPFGGSSSSNKSNVGGSF